METFAFLYVLFLAAGASLRPCEQSGWRCYSQYHPYHVRLAQRMMEEEDIFKSPPIDIELFEPFQVCSGTLIHEQWLLTAGNCYYETNWYSGLKSYPLKVKFSSRSGEYQIIPHENIRMFINDSNADGNIMLVKLPKPVRDIVMAQLPTLPCTRPKIGERLQGVHCHHIPYDSDKFRVTYICTERHVTACVNDCGKETETNSSAVFCARAILKSRPFMFCPEDKGGPILRGEGAAKVIYGVKISLHKFVDVCAEPVRQWINETINEP